ncbi:MAG: pilin [bacterium]|nr:pilin [bacterium]
MLKSFPKILITFFLAVFIFQLISLIFLFALPQISQAADIKFTPQVQGLDYTFDSKDASTGNIARYVRAIYKYAIGIVGILAAVVLMIGGIMWIVAGGNATAIGEAKSWIGASLTGLVIALCSYLILATVNPALVDFKTTPIPGVAEIIAGRCMSASLSNDPDALYTCKDNYTEEQCKKEKTDNTWEKGRYCPTPCCLWEQNVIASSLCKLQFGCVGNSIYVNCDDSKKDMTEAECNQKSGNILGASLIGHSYTKNGKCQKYTFMGTSLLTSYACLPQ